MAITLSQLLELKVIAHTAMQRWLKDKTPENAALMDLRSSELSAAVAAYAEQEDKPEMEVLHLVFPRH